MVMALAGVSALAEQQVDIKEGTYYIKAVNGNAKGQVLYWNEGIDDQNISMMFESCGGSNADYEIWYITKNRNFDDYYGIYLANLSKLKKGKAYYIRARLIDSKGVGSNWSKTKKITTKKK